MTPSFHARFPDEAACWVAWVRLRWPRGVTCSACAQEMGFIRTRKMFQCKGCRRQRSATAGTLLHKSRLPLRTWFHALSVLANAEQGISVRQLQHTLRIRSYRAAWRLEQTIRRALARYEPHFRAQLVRGAVDEAQPHRDYVYALTRWYRRHFSPEETFDQFLAACTGVSR